MKFLAIVSALLIITATFIYSCSYVFQLYRDKAYRGAVGVSVLTLLAVVLPIYVLFFY